MAKEPRRHQSSNELRSELARSRDRLAREFRTVRSELDFPRKIRRSFRENTVLWIGAAVAVGTLVVLLPRRRKVYIDVGTGKKAKGKPQSKLLETGFLLGALRIAAGLAKPAITRFVVNKIRERSGRQAGILRS